MSEYKIEKDRFSVKLLFSDGTVRDGYIFLSFHAAHHEGRELVKDVLNSEEQFIPIDFPGESTKLVNKRDILTISFPLNEHKAEHSMPAFTGVEVAIYLSNSKRLDGRFIFLLPIHASRVKDFLNQRESFLELRKDEEICLINKDHIAVVEER